MKKSEILRLSSHSRYLQELALKYHNESKPSDPPLYKLTRDFSPAEIISLSPPVATKLSLWNSNCASTWTLLSVQNTAVLHARAIPCVFVTKSVVVRILPSIERNTLPPTSLHLSTLTSSSTRTPVAMQRSA